MKRMPCWYSIVWRNISTGISPEAWPILPIQLNSWPTNASATVSKNFETWSTIFYPDKNETWVTLWYTEIMTDKKGKVDSIYYTDDVLVKNNQIVVYDEKQRQFPGPKLK